ncbi:MAG TPA: CDP-alcohol phosphatidyltransferase family protein [Gemmatimonadales bacterium]|jgi:phosphatidylglycerophosphate synthase|nr:CDP-alcohol phosphatidyltransferase family protein [Gemmatimonadales bacterium]
MATRELTFLLAGPERRLLCAIAARLPARIRSNHLTVLGVLGAVGAGAAYALSAWHPAWLWAASACLAVNWFGDSLDGTLARVRHAERPRYGYYLDHSVDAFSTAMIGLGLGLSPYVDFGLALGLVLAYLVLSINVYLESAVFGAFRLGYGRLGPTEVRLILVAGNTGLALSRGLTAPIELIANAVLALALVGMIGMVAVRFGRNLRALAKMEPQRRSASSPGGSFPG